MRRREFISLLGGAVVWPLAARAQQPAKPVIGFVDPRSPEAMTDRLRGFRQGLKEMGYVEEENLATVYRGPKITSIGCRQWRLIWSIGRSR